MIGVAMVLVLLMAVDQDWDLTPMPPAVLQLPGDWDLDNEPAGPPAADKSRPKWPRYDAATVAAALAAGRRLLVCVGQPERAAVAAAAAGNCGWTFAVDDVSMERFADPGLYVLVPGRADNKPALLVERSQVELVDLVTAPPGEKCGPCEAAKTLLRTLAAPYTERAPPEGDHRGYPRVRYRGREVAGYHPQAIRDLLGR